MGWYVGSVDQGTTSTRCILYDSSMRAVASHQIKHEQITPQPGWLQHNPLEILKNAKECIDRSVAKLAEVIGRKPAVRAMGITNQRETVVVWDKTTGRPLYDAIVWCDLRSQDIVDRFSKELGKDAHRAVTGLPASPYFSGFKLKWLVDNVPEVKAALAAGTAIVGTIDSWLLWNLTGKHAISVCNASRTFLADVNTLQWVPSLCETFGVPVAALPQIVPNAQVLGKLTSTTLAGTPVSGLIGDQQSACVGQLCFNTGDTKNTYGTGCFLLMNTGPQPKQSTHGLLTTVCYKIGNEPVQYALEGSVVQAGMLITWLKDNLGIVDDVADVQRLAAKTPDSGGLSIVPAFAGLFAPHWRTDARGIMCGLTMFTKKEHICRAALTSIAMQTVDVIKAMEADSGIKMTRLKADGGMTVNKVLMQLQADLAEVRVAVPQDKETTALGAAVCAAVGAGCMKDLDEVTRVISSRTGSYEEYSPAMSPALREDKKRRWQKALHRSQGWVEPKL